MGTEERRADLARAARKAGYTKAAAEEVAKRLAYDELVAPVIRALRDGDLEITSTRGTAEAREHLDKLLASLK